jgi:hypothetical protein
VASIPRSTDAESHAALDRLGGLRARFHGGPDGNERLTALTGAVLFVLLAALGVTIIQIGQLIWLHLFLGLVLIGPVALKMASTGYRFVFYYLRDPDYRRKGPPETWLRLSAPLVVLTTIGVFATGVPLLFIAPVNREPIAEIHKVFFIVWVVFTALHVLGHLPEMARILTSGRSDSRNQVTGLGGDSGRLPRTIAIAGALVAGLVLAVVFIPHFAAWTSFHHHHH